LVLALGAADAGWLFSSPEKEVVKQQADVSSAGQTSTLQMPGVTPTQNETYLCASFELNNDETHFIVEFDPMAH